MKHFALSFLVLSLSAGFVFANGNGPAPGVNGVFGSAATCAQSGCHSGRPVNIAGGDLSVFGLPTVWTPGQIYPLTVMIARTGAVRYGFQLSTAADSTNTQGGTLTAGNNRVQVINGGSLQFAEHTAAAATPASGLFTLSWQAPANPDIGNVRIDIAASAGYGDSPVNDYIYTQRLTIPPIDIPSSSTKRAYSVTDISVDASRTVDGSSNAKIGFARIVPDTGGTAPSGIAIFGLRMNDTLVSETGVPATPLMQNCRIYAEEDGPLKTGVAVANPGGQTATINFYFTRGDGTEFGAGSTKIPGGGQLAGFLDQAPFNSGSSLQGTFTLISDIPVAVIALRGFTNERGEFLMTTLPVIDLAASPVSSPVLVPYFADGGGWKTSVILVNPTDNKMTGTGQFFRSAGTVSSKFSYSIPRHSSFKFVTAGQTDTTQTGSLSIIPDSGNQAPAPLNVFSYKPTDITVAEAGVATFTAHAFRMYVETTGLPGDPVSIQSGIAVANPYAAPASLNVELFESDGTSTGLTSTVNVPAQGEIAKFLNDIFPSLVPPFQGLVRIVASTPGIAAVGLRSRYNERSDFLITTTPPVDEATPLSSAEFDFPHFVNGGGYTTQFILFSGTAGQKGTGSLKFFAQDGTALPLTLSP